MSADVCPVTRLRCATPETCRSAYCQVNRDLRPIFERDLTEREKYALAMSEKSSRYAARKPSTQEQNK